MPRVPLQHDRAVIAGAVLTSQLRTARRTGHAMYDDAQYQHAAVPEQPVLVDREEQPDTEPGPVVEVQTLRTDLQALELTADQLTRISKAFTALADDAQQARERGPHQEQGATAPRTQNPVHQTPPCLAPSPHHGPGARR
ncbi:hypothetical protein [Streptomyces lydicus]|uniref:hypothetical protein n=1 Tax=Streptomyces lydicus TaxID=47763 RepID=UPI00379B2612